MVVVALYSFFPAGICALLKMKEEITGSEVSHVYFMSALDTAEFSGFFASCP